MHQRTQFNARPYCGQSGFSAVEILITVLVITLVTSFAAMGITRARASIRLAGAAREFASYVEKARVDSIRRHADSEGEWSNVAINSDRTSYTVTFAPYGQVLITRTIPLPPGVTFDTQETIAFDWRGRTQNTVGGTTTANAQVSITLRNSNDFVSVDVTGSGDVTIDSRVFDDSVPDVTLNVNDLSGSPTPTPSVTPAATPTPSATATPTPDGIPIPTPSLLPLPTPEPLPLPTPNPSATPTPTATPTPVPSPTPVVTSCQIIGPDSVSMSAGGTSTIQISHTASNALGISGTSSKPSDLQVTPAAAQTIGVGSVAMFTIKSKKGAGTYAVTFASNTCEQKAVAVVVQ